MFLPWFDTSTSGSRYASGQPTSDLVIHLEDMSGLTLTEEHKFLFVKQVFLEILIEGRRRQTIVSCSLANIALLVSW